MSPATAREAIGPHPRPKASPAAPAATAEGGSGGASVPRGSAIIATGRSGRRPISFSGSGPAVRAAHGVAGGAPRRSRGPRRAFEKEAPRAGPYGTTTRDPADRPAAAAACGGPVTAATLASTRGARLIIVRASPRPYQESGAAGEGVAAVLKPRVAPVQRSGVPLFV